MARVERTHLGLLLILSFLTSLALLGLAGWAANEVVDSTITVGNNATGILTIFSLIAGLATVAAVFAGTSHFRAWRVGSLSGAASLALLAWLFSLLALGFGAKQIAIGLDGLEHEKEFIALASLAIALGGLNTFYVLGIHAGIYDAGYGMGY